jgi:hypothetical protein
MVVVDDNSNIKWKKIKLLNATTFQGRIRDFKLGGGGGALKKITPKNHIFSNCGDRREHFWGISCEKLYIMKYYIKHSSP